MPPPDWRQPLPKSYVWLSRFSGMGAVGSDMAMISWRSSSPITSYDIWRSGTSSSCERLRDPDTAHQQQWRRIAIVGEGNTLLMLFIPPHDELTDEGIAAVLRQAIAKAGRLPRQAEVFLAGICAEHLVEGLRAAGLLVVRPVRWRLHQ